MKVPKMNIHVKGMYFKVMRAHDTLHSSNRCSINGLMRTKHEHFKMLVIIVAYGHCLSCIL